MLQNLTLQIVVSVLNSTKGTEIPQVLKSLSEDAQDTLMKYIYKGMGMPGWGDVSGSVLLAWHEKVSIVRLPWVMQLIDHSSGVRLPAYRDSRHWVHCTCDVGSEDCVSYKVLYLDNDGQEFPKHIIDCV